MLDMELHNLVFSSLDFGFAFAKLFHSSALPFQNKNVYACRVSILLKYLAWFFLLLFLQDLIVKKLGLLQCWNLKRLWELLKLGCILHYEINMSKYNKYKGQKAIGKNYMFVC